MKIILSTLCMLLVAFVSSGQNFAVPGVFDNTSDITGKPFMENTRDVEGSPMLSEDWIKGTIFLQKGTAYKNVLMKFNMATNEVYFQHNNKSLVVAEPVVQFKLEENNIGFYQPVLFRSGYPDAGLQNSNTFYKVLAEGVKYQLLKYSSVKIEEIKGYSSGTHQRYITKELLYVYDVVSKKMIFVKPSKNSITDALPAEAAAIEKIIAANNLKVKNENELVALILALNNG